jgi:hypothetical protein
MTVEQNAYSVRWGGGAVAKLLHRTFITELRSAPCSCHSQWNCYLWHLKPQTFPSTNPPPPHVVFSPLWNHNTMPTILHCTFSLQLCYMHKSVPIHCTVLFICWLVLHVSAWPTAFDPSPPHVYCLFRAQCIQYSPNIWYVLCHLLKNFSY